MLIRARPVVAVDLSDLSCRKAVVDGVKYRIVRKWPGWEVRRTNARATAVGGWTFWGHNACDFCRGHRRAMKAIWAALERMEADTGRSMYQLLT